MSKAEGKRAEITPVHEEEARRLRELWAAFKEARAEHGDSISQATFGSEYGIGTQGAVWQFMKPLRPLSMKAAKGFAEGLGVEVGAFSPRLQREINELNALGEGADGDRVRALTHAALEIAEKFDALPDLFVGEKTKIHVLNQLLGEIQKWARMAAPVGTPSAAPTPRQAPAPKTRPGKARVQ